MGGGLAAGECFTDSRATSQASTDLESSTDNTTAGSLPPRHILSARIG